MMILMMILIMLIIEPVLAVVVVVVVAAAAVVVIVIMITVMRCFRKRLGISYRDHITNEEVKTKLETPSGRMKTS